MFDPTQVIDVESDVQLAEVADLVALSRESKVLRRGDCDLAVVLPLATNISAPAEKRRGVREAAGSWQGFDADRFKQEVREARDAGASDDEV